jgi:hypothetical protein
MLDGNGFSAGTDQGRAEFEAWAISEGLIVDRHYYGDKERYASITTQSAFRGWQAARRAQVVPNGWKLVPEEPTPAMYDRVMREGYYHDDPKAVKAVLRAEYQDMLAAAPQPPVAAQEPIEVHEPKCPALIGDACTCDRHGPAADKAWARFCAKIGDGPNAPYPGMISAFERYYAQSFTDKDWRREASVWAAAWKQAMLAAAPTTQAVPAAVAGPSDEDAARARLIAQTAQRFAEDRTHLGQLVYVNDLVWALHILSAAPTTQVAPVAQGDALTDTYVQQVPDKCDRIVWRGRYYHLPIDAAEHSYTEPSPMAKVAAALRQKAEQEDAAYQARRSDQGLMESEWGPMEDAPPHEDPPMHVAVVEGDDTVRTLQWNRDVAAFAYPAGTLLYAARSQAKEGGAA